LAAGNRPGSASSHFAGHLQSVGQSQCDDADQQRDDFAAVWRVDSGRLQYLLAPLFYPFSRTFGGESRQSDSGSLLADVTHSFLVDSRRVTAAGAVDDAGLRLARGVALSAGGRDW